MKLVAVALLVFGVLCNSTLAVAEGPVPFAALMQSAGAQPSAPPITDATDQSTPASTHPTHTHMTTGGKIMTGTGIFMFASGMLVIVGTAVAVVSDRGRFFSLSSSDQAKLYGAGGGLAAGGATLIILGSHRRSAQ